ncbi:hypothetical protein BD414DRAFT_121314 [Trametes punicea]|nr:hypothetical protein BD414DRAFT_121314 [Trametes punicea]
MRRPPLSIPLSLSLLPLAHTRSLDPHPLGERTDRRCSSRSSVRNRTDAHSSCPASSLSHILPAPPSQHTCLETSAGATSAAAHRHICILRPQSALPRSTSMHRRLACHIPLIVSSPSSLPCRTRNIPIDGSLRPPSISSASARPRPATVAVALPAVLLSCGDRQRRRRVCATCALRIDRRTSRPTVSRNRHLQGPGLARAGPKSEDHAGSVLGSFVLSTTVHCQDCGLIANSGVRRLKPPFRLYERE